MGAGAVKRTLRRGVILVTGLGLALVAGQAGWYPFGISTQPAGAELYTTWKLFSCEAKNL